MVQFEQIFGFGFCDWKVLGIFGVLEKMVEFVLGDFCIDVGFCYDGFEICGEVVFFEFSVDELKFDLEVSCSYLEKR